MAGRRQVTRACHFLTGDFRDRAACAVADGSPFRAAPASNFRPSEMADATAMSRFVSIGR
jgi:hypothetical protein